MFWTHWLAPMFLSTCLGMSVPRCREDCMKHTKPGPKQLQKVNYYNGIISLKQSLSLPQQAGDRGCEEDRFLLPSERDNLNRTCSSPGTWVSYSTTCPPSSRSSQTGYWLPFITSNRWPSKIQRKKKKKTWVTAVRGMFQNAKIVDVTFDACCGPSAFLRRQKTFHVERLVLPIPKM